MKCLCLITVLCISINPFVTKALPLKTFESNCHTIMEYLKINRNVDLSICDKLHTTNPDLQGTPLYFLAFCDRIKKWSTEDAICNDTVTHLLDFDKRVSSEKGKRLQEICQLLPQIRPDLPLENCTSFCSGPNYDACNLYESLDYFIRQAIFKGTQANYKTLDKYLEKYDHLFALFHSWVHDSPCFKAEDDGTACQRMVNVVVRMIQNYKSFNDSYLKDTPKLTVDSVCKTAENVDDCKAECTGYERICWISNIGQDALNATSQPVVNKDLANSTPNKAPTVKPATNTGTKNAATKTENIVSESTSVTPDFVGYGSTEMIFTTYPLPSTSITSENENTNPVNPKKEKGEEHVEEEQNDAGDITGEEKKTGEKKTGEEKQLGEEKQPGEDQDTGEEQPGEDQDIGEEQPVEDQHTGEKQPVEDQHTGEKQPGDQHTGEEQTGEDQHTGEEQTGEDQDTGEEQPGEDQDTGKEQPDEVQDTGEEEQPDEDQDTGEEQPGEAQHTGEEEQPDEEQETGEEQPDDNQQTDEELEEEQDKTPGGKADDTGAMRRPEDDDEESSSNFMAYFLLITVLCITGYILFHNKQKIIAMMVEGRGGGGNGRRPSTKQYKQLKTEDVMPSLEKSASRNTYVF